MVVSRRLAEQQLLRVRGFGSLLVVACIVVALQIPPRDHFTHVGTVVILDEAAAKSSSTTASTVPMDVKQLKREIDELEKQEMSHAQARQAVGFRVQQGWGCRTLRRDCGVRRYRMRWRGPRRSTAQRRMPATVPPKRSDGRPAKTSEHLRTRV